MIASFAMGFAFCFFADRIIPDNKFKSQNNHYYSSENCINVRGTILFRRYLLLGSFLGLRLGLHLFLRLDSLRCKFLPRRQFVSYSAQTITVDKLMDNVIIFCSNQNLSKYHSPSNTLYHKHRFSKLTNIRDLSVYSNVLAQMHRRYNQH